MTMTQNKQRKFIRILKTYSCGYVMEGHEPGYMKKRVEIGPILPLYRCIKMKWIDNVPATRLSWDVSPNDPRFASIQAITNLIPTRVSPYNPQRTYTDQWELSMEEYRGVAGREGPMKG